MARHPASINVVFAVACSIAASDHHAIENA
jgi:hypothetical protein